MVTPKTDEFSGKLAEIAAAVVTIGSVVSLLVAREKFDRQEAANDIRAHLYALTLDFAGQWEAAAERSIQASQTTTPG